MHELWLWDKYAWDEKLFNVKIVCIHFSTEIMSFTFFRIYTIRPFLMIYLSSNYYFRALLFWNRNPFLETNSSLVLGNFFRENKHDLKRFVVYLEVDNMGKHFFCANWIWIADWLKRWYILPWSFFFWHQFKNVSCDLNSIAWSIFFFTCGKREYPLKNRCEKKIPLVIPPLYLSRSLCSPFIILNWVSFFGTD